MDDIASDHGVGQTLWARRAVAEDLTGEQRLGLKGAIEGVHHRRHQPLVMIRAIFAMSWGSPMNGRFAIFPPPGSSCLA
jgi:hypothetical protein